METREKFLQNVRDREKDFQELKQAEESITVSINGMAPFISSGDICFRRKIWEASVSLWCVNWRVLFVVQCSAQTAVSESERIFSEVLCSVQKTSVHVTELIAERQREELSHIEGLQEKVQQKISDLRLKVSELDPFLTTEDHIHFLQVQQTNSPDDDQQMTLSTPPPLRFKRKLLD